MPNPTPEDVEKRSVEGSLPHVTRPQPGPRKPRAPWRGLPTTSVVAPRRAAHRQDLSHPTPLASHLTGAQKLSRGRVEGIDIARGFALIGMVLVHTYPMSNEDSRTLAWLLFSGKSAPLFAVLAGVSLAFMTGGSKPYIRSRMAWSKKSIVVRSLALVILGLAVNSFFSPAAENILPYYALMFLLALPFIGWRITSLLVAALVVTIVSPVLVFFVMKYSDFAPIENASFLDIANQPLAVLMNYLFVGTYPMAVWLAYTLLGMALGRMALNRRRVQWGILFYGFLATAAAFVTSELFMRWLPTHRILIDAIGGPAVTGKAVIEEYLVFGASDADVFTTSPLWLLANGPHMNTPVSTIHAAGLACVAIGGLSVATRYVYPLLRPLAMVGSMTLTLYLAHIVGLGYLGQGSVTADPNISAVIQLAVAFAFAYLWRVSFASGPLEKAVTVVAKGGATALSDGTPPSGNAQRRIYFTHDYRFDPTKGEV